MNKSEEEQVRFLFGISLTDRPRWQQILICSSVFFFGYLVNSVCELTMVEVLHICSRISLPLFNPPTGLHIKANGEPMEDLHQALCHAYGLTKGSLAFLNYPAQLMFKSTKMEMLFCSTVVGLPFLIPPMIFTGELFKAWHSCSQHLYVYGVLVFEAMATFIGQVSVLSLIALFGAASTAMITTARKAVALTEQHGTGLLLIGMGITLKLLPENDRPCKKKTSSSVQSSNVKCVADCGDDRAHQLQNAEVEEKRLLV